jgi:hypothetical protein
VVHDLVYAVERILFVDDGIEQNAEGPNILLFPTVGSAGEYFWGSVVCGELAK